MARNNIEYFLNKNSDFALSDPRLHYSFDFVSGNALIENQISGYSDSFLYSSLGLPLDFSEISGSGKFNETVLEIYNNTGSINFGKDFTFLLVGDGIGSIFQGYCSGLVDGEILHSGFNFGINDAHKLFFEYRVGEKVESRTFSENLNNNNSLFVSFTESEKVLKLGAYNYLDGSVSSEEFLLEKTELFDSRQCYVGGGTISGEGFFNKNYSGFIDEFLFFQTSLDELDIKLANSGFVMFFDSSNSGLYVDSVEVTGYETVTGITFSGVTGFQTIETGVLVDEFGNEYSGVYVQELTGYETGFYQQPLTGVVSVFSGSVFGDDALSADTSYLALFGKNKLSAGFIESQKPIGWQLVYNTGLFDLAESFNNALNFDRALNAPSILKSSRDMLFFVDGAFNQSGTALLTGSYYEKDIFISGGDFYTSGFHVYSTGKYKNEQSYIADFINFEEIFVLNGFSHSSGTGDYLFDINDSSLLFFNGKRIFSGELENQYIRSGVSGAFVSGFDLFGGETGILSALDPKDLEITSILSGDFINLNNANFIPGFVACYLNNFRQFDPGSFIESAKLDLAFSGCSKSLNNKPVYDNNGLFFE